MAIISVWIHISVGGGGQPLYKRRVLQEKPGGPAPRHTTQAFEGQNFNSLKQGNGGYSPLLDNNKMVWHGGLGCEGVRPSTDA